MRASSSMVPGRSASGFCSEYKICAGGTDTWSSGYSGFRAPLRP